MTQGVVFSKECDVSKVGFRSSHMWIGTSLPREKFNWLKTTIYLQANGIADYLYKKKSNKNFRENIRLANCYNI